MQEITQGYRRPETPSPEIWALVAAALAAVAAIWPSVGAWAAVVTLRGERWQRTSPRNVMSSCGSSTVAPLASFAVSMIGARQRMAVPFLVQNSSPSANKSSRCRTQGQNTHRGACDENCDRVQTDTMDAGRLERLLRLR